MKVQSKKLRKEKHISGEKTRKIINRAPDKKENIIPQVRDLIEPLCEAEGIELVHLEYQREAGGRILRLFIDRPGGVTLDDCAYISRQSGDILDVYLENTGPYSLEVSSPGPNRPLAKKRDYERFTGRKVKIKTIKPLAGQKNFTGILTGISEGVVKISIDDTHVAIPFEEIAKAQLVSNR